MVCLLPIFHLENPIREGCELQYNTVNYSLHPSLNNASLPAGLESSIVYTRLDISCSNFSMSTLSLLFLFNVLMMNWVRSVPVLSV